MDLRYWTFLGLASLSMGLLVWGVHGIWHQYLDPRQQALRKRLKTAVPIAADEPGLQLRSIRLMSTIPSLESWLRKAPGTQALDQVLLQTGLALSVAQTLTLGLGLVLLMVAAGISLNWPVPLTLALALLSCLMLAAWLQHRRSQRMALIGLALPDALDLIARSMQAGHAFTSALQLAAKDSPPPLSHELRAVFEEINFGVSTAQALQALSTRVVSEDVRYFVVAVVIQNETGGNLAETLSNLADVLRKRSQMKLKIRAMSSESKASAYIVGSLPFMVFTMIYWINPKYLGGFFTDDRLIVTGLGGLVWMSIGAFIMAKMVSFEI